MFSVSALTLGLRVLLEKHHVSHSFISETPNWSWDRLSLVIATAPVSTQQLTTAFSHLHQHDSKLNDSGCAGSAGPVQ